MRRLWWRQPARRLLQTWSWITWICTLSTGLLASRYSSSNANNFASCDWLNSPTILVTNTITWLLPVPALLWCSAWPWPCDSGSWSLPQGSCLCTPLILGMMAWKLEKLEADLPAPSIRQAAFLFSCKSSVCSSQNHPLWEEGLLCAASLQFLFVCYRIREQKKAFLFSISLLNYQVLNAVQIELTLQSQFLL